MLLNKRKTILLGLQEKKKKSNLVMSTEQGSQGSIDIEDANSSRLKSIANVISIDSYLTAKYKTRIRDVLGDGSNFELRLHLALQPDISNFEKLEKDS